MNLDDAAIVFLTASAAALLVGLTLGFALRTDQGPSIVVAGWLLFAGFLCFLAGHWPGR